ncbi:MAG: alpha/beta hydrolase [Pseudomonadota bacterium]
MAAKRHEVSLITSVSKFLFVIIALYCAVALMMFLLQRQLLYHPSNVNPDPRTVGLRGVDVISLETPDGESIILWHAPAPRDRPHVLFFQGNGGESANRADRFAAYQDAGFGVVFVSWRGYGGSSGAPSETGFMTDARAAYDWLWTTGVEAEKIALVGESLDTGVVVQLAAEQAVGVVLLGAPFTAAVDIAALQYPWLPVRLLMKDQFRSRDYIDQIAAPILIQHGTEDRVVPYALGQELSVLAGDHAAFVTVPNEGHEMLYGPEILEREIAFIQNALSP